MIDFLRTSIAALVVALRLETMLPQMSLMSVVKGFTAVPGREIQLLAEIELSATTFLNMAVDYNGIDNSFVRTVVLFSV